MNTMVEVHNSEKNIELLKWFVSVILLLAGLYGYHHYDQYPFQYRLLALLPVIAVSIYVMVQTVQGRRCLRLIQESVLEAKRVVWPTKQETTQTTLIVVTVVFVAGLILWILDVLLNWLTSMVMV